MKPPSEVNRSVTAATTSTLAVAANTVRRYHGRGNGVGFQVAVAFDAAMRAEANSAPVAYRSAGVVAMARSTTSSTCGGTVARYTRIGCGRFVSRCARIDW